MPKDQGANPLETDALDVNLYGSHPLRVEATIRPAVASDIRKLEWFGQYWSFRHIFEHTYNEQLKGNRLMMVADVNDFPVGQLFIQLASSESRFADGTTRAYFYSLRVMDPFQGLGLGTKLLRVGERILVARGYTWATIAVAKENSAARRLYERLGFRVFGDDPGRWSYRDPDGKVRRVREPAWILEKNFKQEI